MKKRNLFIGSLYAAIALMVLPLASCGGREEVDSCGKYDAEANKDKCNNAKLKDGTNCKFDETKKKCKPDKEKVEKKVVTNCKDVVNPSAEECPKNKDSKGKCGYNTTTQKCESKGQQTPKVNVYTLTEVPAATIKIDGDKIKGVAASGDGKYIYAIGTANATLKSFDSATSGANWDDAAGDWNAKFQTGKPRANAADLSGQHVDNFAPTSEGLLFGISGNSGLVVLKGTGAANTTLYPQGAVGNLADGELVPFFATSSAAAPNNQFIYVANKTALPANSIVYRKYTPPPTADNPAGVGGTAGDVDQAWNNTLAKAAATQLSHVATAIAQKENNGDLYFADAEGIHFLPTAEIGVTAKTYKADTAGSTVVLPPAKLELVAGTANSGAVKQMAFLGDTLIIIPAGGAANTGGVILWDTTQAAATATPKTFGKGKTVTGNAITILKKGKGIFADVAGVSTDKGLLVVNKTGESIGIDGAKDADGIFITGDYINSKQAVTKASAGTKADGFDGVKPVGRSNVKGVAEDQAGKLYIALEGKTAESPILVVEWKDVDFQ